MTTEITSPNKKFEDIKHVQENGVEYWLARELMEVLGYTQWRNFEEVIMRAARAAVQSGQSVDNHFARISKMVKIGSNAGRTVLDWKLDRYACYLMAQNGDPNKQEIAIAQTYFATQTRKQELLEQLPENERRLHIRNEVKNENKQLHSTAKKKGVSQFGLFNDAGYRGLYGMPLSEVEQRKSIKKGELLDRAGSTELAANLFRITQTEEKLRNDSSIQGEESSRRTHFMIGGKVRQTIKDIGGVLPEHLKPEIHIKELEKEKKLKNKIETKKQKLLRLK